MCDRYRYRNRYRYRWLPHPIRTFDCDTDGDTDSEPAGCRHPAGFASHLRRRVAEGREIRKTRPAVVVSNNVACRYDSVVQVLPITGLPDRQLRPYEALLDSESCGLGKTSRAVANQIRTIAKHRVTKRVGRLTTAEIKAVDRVIEIQLAPRRVP
jgi:mRNA interferase MazF